MSDPELASPTWSILKNTLIGDEPPTTAIQFANRLRQRAGARKLRDPEAYHTICV